MIVVVLAGGRAAAWAWWNGSPRRRAASARTARRPRSARPAELDPEQAGNAAIIAGVAVRRGLPARAATIGIATALQESKLVNSPDGDRDSLGLFQQRPSQGWGTPTQVARPGLRHERLLRRPGQDRGLPEPADHRRRPRRCSGRRSRPPTPTTSPRPGSGPPTLAGYSPAGLNCVLSRDAASRPRRPRRPTASPPRARRGQAPPPREAGRSGSAAAADGATRSGSAPSRAGTRAAGLGLAQWAVARADDLDVVAVEVDGQQWRRDRSTEGWTPLDGGPTRARSRPRSRLPHPCPRLTEAELAGRRVEPRRHRTRTVSASRGPT